MAEEAAAGNSSCLQNGRITGGPGVTSGPSRAFLNPVVEPRHRSCPLGYRCGEGRKLEEAGVRLLSRLIITPGSDVDPETRSENAGAGQSERRILTRTLESCSIPRGDNLDKSADFYH